MDNHTRDLRLQRVYGITLDEYNAILEKQNGTCAICLRPPVNYNLAVDHDHRYDRIKVKISKWGPKKSFVAVWTEPFKKPSEMFGENREKLRDAVRRYLRKTSVRGLLCMSCNKGLQYFRDIPERFDRAASYLRWFLPNVERMLFEQNLAAKIARDTFRQVIEVEEEGSKIHRDGIISATKGASSEKVS